MQHVYLAACAENGGIYHYVMEEDGHMTARSFTPLPFPMYLAREGQHLYALLRAPFADSEDSALTILTIDDAGEPTVTGSLFSTKGRCACHLTVKNGEAWAVNYLSGSAIHLPQGEIVTHSGKGPHPTRQDGPHTHYIGLSPDGSHLLVTDLGVDAIFLYTKDMQALGRLSLPAGAGPRHLAFSPDGKLLYCANELGCSVSVFAYDGIRSRLLETIPTLPTDFTQENTTAAIRVVGDELFVSDRGFDMISVFVREGTHLHLSYRIPTGGHSPRDFHITPNGKYLLCTNEFSDNVTLFARGSDGRFSPLPQVLTMPRPLCVIFA